MKPDGENWGGGTSQALIVAALALHHNCSLATHNVEHFRHTGVTLANPWQMSE
jgi:predicted nucleic acid-binding protein